jgi:hypothetical protein
MPQVRQWGRFGRFAAFQQLADVCSNFVQLSPKAFSDNRYLFFITPLSNADFYLSIWKHCVHK